MLRLLKGNFKQLVLPMNKTTLYLHSYDRSLQIHLCTGSCTIHPYSCTQSWQLYYMDCPAHIRRYLTKENMIWMPFYPCLPSGTAQNCPFFAIIILSMVLLLHVCIIRSKIAVSLLTLYKYHIDFFKCGKFKMKKSSNFIVPTFVNKKCNTSLF